MPTNGDHARAVRDAIARLFHLLGVERKGLDVVLVYSVGIGIASLAAPIGVQMLVSAIAFGGLAQPVVILSLLVLTALTFAAVLRAAQAWVVERIQQRLFVRVATDLAERLPRLSIPSLDAYYAPELVNRFFDVLTVQKGASMLLLDGVFVTLQMVVGGTLLALYNPSLLAFASVILIAIALILFGLGRRGAETSIEESKVKYALVGWFEEVARHPVLFRSPGGAAFALERSNALVGEYVRARHRHYRVLFRQTVAFLALQAVATAGLLALGGVLVLQGQLTLGQLVAAELILTSVVAGFAKFGKYLETYYDLVAAMDKLGKLVSIPLERDGGTSGRAADAPRGIRVIGAEYTHAARGAEGLARVSLDVPAGARVAIVGPNGSGKSTLIDLLFGLREPVRGHVELDGLPLRELSLRDLRREIALVRGAEIFDGSILENLTMGRGETALEDVKMALQAVGLWEEIVSLPDGLQTRITTRGGNVSAGQAQRLALARALVARPKFLLLDEALDHLDPAARATVLGRVLGADAPWTTVVATHDPAVAQACSSRFVLERGVLSPLSEGGSAS